METEIIFITEYCNNTNIEPQFIFLLEEEGLITIDDVNGEPVLFISELRDIERYARWYYDLSINIAGIDTIQQLLRRMENLQNEISQLRKLVNSSHVKLYLDELD